MELPGNQKKHQKFYCEKCDFSCSRQKEMERHESTSKHIFSHDWKSQEITKNTRRQKIKCECGHIYETKSGLWKHKKICSLLVNKKNEDNNVICYDDSSQKNTVETKVNSNLEPIFYNGKDISNLKPEECSLDIIMHLVKQNEEFQKIMLDQNHKFLEIQEQMINLSGSTTNINSHNKTMNNQFNLNLFLNETCKDAMNINDFIDYVTVNLDDFENFGKVGYPKALGEIIVRNLNELDVKIRPIHCSDLKREVLHVKHDGVWHSDDSQKFIKKSITYVANKNIRQRPQWQEENPESKNCLTTSFEYYNNICLASLGPATDEQEADFLKKITTTIAKQVVIDKKKKY